MANVSANAVVDATRDEIRSRVYGGAHRYTVRAEIQFEAYINRATFNEGREDQESLADGIALELGDAVELHAGHLSDSKPGDAIIALVVGNHGPSPEVEITQLIDLDPVDVDEVHEAVAAAETATRPRPQATTDQEAVDAPATLLGTSAEWSSASDFLDDIANIVGRVRPHPSSDAAEVYRDRFAAATGRQVPNMWDSTDDHQ